MACSRITNWSISSFQKMKNAISKDRCSLNSKPVLKETERYGNTGYGSKATMPNFANRCGPKWNAGAEEAHFVLLGGRGKYHSWGEGDLEDFIYAYIISFSI